MSENRRWVQLPMYLRPPLSIGSGTIPHSQMTVGEAKHRFCQIATKAIEMGLLTLPDLDTIRRHGTRKRGNWKRHLRNLCDYLDDM